LGSDSDVSGSYTIDQECLVLLTLAPIDISECSWMEYNIRFGINNEIQRCLKVGNIEIRSSGRDYLVVIAEYPNQIRAKLACRTRD
jgi:hypothetical protein